MRKRIVINLDGPKGDAAKPVRKRRRWRRVLSILALLFLLVVAVTVTEAYLWWRHYRAMPAYTVVVLVDAAARNDMSEFQEHINADEIAKNMVTNVSRKAAARYGYALNSSIQQQIDERVPSLLLRLQETVRNEVRNEIAFYGLAPHGRSFFYLLLNVPPLLTITTEGDTAKVMLPRGMLMIELTMQRYADGWKVTEFKDEFAIQRIVDSIMTDLPAIGEIDANSPLLKKPERRKSNR